MYLLFTFKSLSPWCIKEVNSENPQYMRQENPPKKLGKS